MTILFWDIDGTLLTTGRAGIHAWEDAYREVGGRALDLTSIRTDGLTDHQVAQLILREAGTEETPDIVHRMVAVYERELPGRLHVRKGRCLDNVRDVLDHLRANRPDVKSLLLTGNTSAGARAKLTHYELAGFFEAGAFSEDTGPRSAIATRAAAIAAAGRHATSSDRLFVIGDTPHDIHAGAAIGARTIALATGGYSAQELSVHAPWVVLDCLPSPALFERLIDSPEAVSGTSVVE